MQSSTFLEGHDCLRKHKSQSIVTGHLPNHVFEEEEDSLIPSVAGYGMKIIFWGNWIKNLGPRLATLWNANFYQNKLNLSHGGSVLSNILQSMYDPGSVPKHWTFYCTEEMKRKWKENLDKGLDTQPFFSMSSTPFSRTPCSMKEKCTNIRQMDGEIVPY